MSGPALRTAAIALALVAAGRSAAAQTPSAASASDRPAWDLSALLYNYFIPDDRDYLQPTLTADRGALHLEARANYEGRGVGSAWFGWNFSVGTHVVFDITPMIGGVFGDTMGAAAGARSALTWRALEVSSESEYVFDANSRSDWFYYNWSELSFSPVDWLRVGLAGQRTRAYASERDIQRGFLVGFSTPHVDVTAYMFNPDDENPTYVLSASLNFQLPRVRK